MQVKQKISWPCYLCTTFNVHRIHNFGIVQNFGILRGHDVENTNLLIAVICSASVCRFHYSGSNIMQPCKFVFRITAYMIRNSNWSLELLQRDGVGSSFLSVLMRGCCFSRHEFYCFFKSLLVSPNQPSQIGITWPLQHLFCGCWKGSITSPFPSPTKYQQQRFNQFNHISISISN